MVELLAFGALIVVGWFILSAVVSFTFTVVSFIFMVLIWILTGWIAGQLIRGKGYGPVKDGLLGLAGGIIGSIVLGLVGWDFGGIIGSIITGVVGALILIYGMRAFSDNKRFGA